MRTANQEQPFDASAAAQPLDVIAGDQASHAVRDDRDRGCHVPLLNRRS
jgi:hypothetical protein